MFMEQGPKPTSASPSKDATLIASATVGGAALGAVTTAVIGSIGVAAVGTAFALPVIAIAAGLGLLGSGLFVLGRRLGRNR